jgi:hypothetical protein
MGDDNPSEDAQKAIRQRHSFPMAAGAAHQDRVWTSCAEVQMPSEV